MKVNPLSFFNFCSQHIPLLRRLAADEGELSEADIRHLIKLEWNADCEQPETTWRRLRELQILIPVESDGDFYFMADPVRRLLAYLFDEARATTPQIVRGYINSLDEAGKRLNEAIDTENRTALNLTVESLQETLRRVRVDLDETHRCILTEVARYKTENKATSVRDRFRRIVHWMESYVDPMVEIVRPDGTMRSTFDEVERLLKRAREQAMFNDLPRIEHIQRQLRLVQTHALRVFKQCRRELTPLYESLRRSSFISEGAELALERLRTEGVSGWAEPHGVPICSLKLQLPPTDTAITRAVDRLTEHPPQPAPTIDRDLDDSPPEEYLRLQWLESLSSRIHTEKPVSDLLEWIGRENPPRNTGDSLAGLTRILFDESLDVRFNDDSPRAYETLDGTLNAHRMKVEDK